MSMTRERICPLPFEKEAARYYRIKACFEPVSGSEVGTVFSKRMQIIMFLDFDNCMKAIRKRHWPISGIEIKEIDKIYKIASVNA